MPNINLLPWREELNEVKKQEFFILLGVAALIAAVILLFAHMYESHRISVESENNAYLEKQVKKLDDNLTEIASLKDEKAKLISRIKIIQELQVSRPRIVQILESFVKAVPDGLYFTLVKRTGNDILIEGKAESSTRVSTLMRNLDATSLFEPPDLKSIQTDQDVHSTWKNFSMTLHQKNDL